MDTKVKLTVAELKRRLTVGTKLRKVYRPRLLATQPRECDEIVTVHKVQSNSIAFNTEQGVGWLDWPKGSELIETPKGFEIYRGEKLCLRYEWVNQ